MSYTDFFYYKKHTLKVKKANTPIYISQSTGVVLDIIRYSQHLTVKRDDVIFQQGKQKNG